MTQTMQSELFNTSNPPKNGTGLYAEIVFDRPLDHAFTYAVPKHLQRVIGLGKRVLTPFGRGDRQTVGFCVGLTEDPPNFEDVKQITRVLDEEPLLTDPLMRLTRWMADYYLCGWGQVLNAVLPAGAKEQSGTRNVIFVEAVPEDQLPEEEPKLTPKQKTALRLLRENEEAMEQRLLTREAQCGASVIDALVNKEVAKRTTRRVDTSSLHSVESPVEPDQPKELSEDQAQVWQKLEPTLEQGGFHPFLLHGVTGSGKTEIYLRAIEKVLAQGKEAIVLVPEISLTPQTIRRFRGRCKDVAVLHSHLGNAERGGHWRRVANGEIQVVVGARSAVFAPTKNLGLIVIDEEHENTFKQESTPRYHARDVAVMRARLENVPILMGSATPALESWNNAHKGQYDLLSLPRRVMDRPLPRVSLIDMRHEAPNRRFGQGLSLGLEQAMRDTLMEGGQVMLLLNRRGFSTHVHCTGCGFVEQCRDCDLSMTYHRNRHLMLCHYCGFEAEPPQRCSSCGQAHVRYQGLGTEKLQNEIESKFSNYVVRRMDSDTMRKPGSHERVLNAFRDGLIHVLMGTQMIAKGLDFPNVTLVGVINADIGLHLPDFRASERTFQILSQVAGRTGRGERGGRVLIQTFTPDHPAVALACDHDYASFVRSEVALRQAHRYPPFERMIRVLVRSKNETDAGEFAERMSHAFHEAQEQLKREGELKADVRLLGPAEAPVFRLKSYYRFHFQLQSESSATLHRLVRAVSSTIRIPSSCEVMIDVDPFNMM